MSGALDIGALYDAHVDFVARMASRLGVHASAIDDVVQEVFLVAHRRRDDFRFDSSARTWIGGITIRVARERRRSEARHDARTKLVTNHEPPRRPDELFAEGEALNLVLRLLDALDGDQREVLVLTEFEQLSTPEIAAMTDSNVNTVSSRLRLARKHFNELVAAHQRTEEVR